MTAKLLVILSFLGCAVSSPAVLVTFSGNDPGANSIDPRPVSLATAALFDTAAGNLGVLNVIDFESAPLGFLGNLNVAPGVTLTSELAKIRIGPEGNPDRLYGYNTTPGGQQFAAFEGKSIIFTFATPIQSFGAYFSGVQQVISSQIQFNDGTSQVIDLDQGTGLGGIQFVGFTDSGRSISSVSLVMDADFVGMDDVRYGAVPEPGSFVAITLGVSLMIRRRQK